ncbi:DnaJ family domain-containing protein [Nocardia macrotermitis]|uniref:DnaJ homologue subfamily C member 28 conserved domain-containing protein n=1 Tax=Nocardia macrotermitis TaxID=2585198 RepID=A0A7K0CV31_9NOCA|nr:DUF1992 domain-containing protein [Nocardia macrotermitis]MQY17360.1 hypothetical protein [Nocardia macrotermitis]
MTERKPAGMTYESWLDKQIREATDRGEFDDLPGAGKPLPDAGQRYDEDWWLKDYLRREGVSGDGVLPPSLLLRRDVERLPEAVRAMNSEQRVREHVSELNDRIVAWLRMPHGPHVNVTPVDADEAVAQWRARRQPPAPREEPAAERPPAASRWRALFRRRR